MSIEVPLFWFERVSDEHPQSTITAGYCQTEPVSFVGDEFDVLDGFVLGSAVDQWPFVLLPFALIGPFALVYSDLGVEGARGNDCAEFGPSPLDFPGGSSLNFNAFILDPLVGLLGVHPDEFIRAGDGESPAGPVEAHIVDDGLGG